ncbi:Virulence protein [Mannheimia haemolytica]|uniref:Virulence protein n=1 Tax=Mannheimia haemolytica TaxID=75985 RepID=A0A378MYQ1_MANHA|nr:Virulence protein [Mannheimia haemolytica]
MMAVLYDVDVRTISYHLKKIFSDNELAENSVIQFFWITAQDGKNYHTKHYNLSAIIAVGYKVNSERAVQFRKWATEIVHSFAIKGFAMDDERLKNDGTILGKKYFEEQLARIREIRLSERKFYQKSPTFTLPPWTTTAPQPPPNAFLPPCRTSSIGQFTAYRRRADYGTSQR